MTQSLKAGANVLLTRNGSPSELEVFVSWDFRGSEFYIDVNALACDTSGKVLDDTHFVYFNNRSSPDGGLTLQHVEVATATERERLTVNLAKFKEAVDRVLVSAVVYETQESGKSFKDTESMGVRVQNGGAILASYELEPITDSVTALILCELYRNKGEWKFRAVGQGYRGGLQALADDHDLHL
jgi:tellurium resistance protein TerD